MMRLTLIVFAIGILASSLAVSESAYAQSLRGSKPNIILVMTDDQGMGDLSCMGNTVLRTPNLDRFYQMSTRLTDFHVSPTCAPTRASIMSGRHEFRNGVTHTILERERMALSTTTFPQLLQTAGYSTGIFGKWHLGDEPEYQPGQRGFHEVFIHGGGGIGQSYPGSCADFPPNQLKPYFDPVLLHNETIVQTQGFCTDVFFQAALGWIRKQQLAETPFFAYLATNAPHGPMLAPQKYKQRFADMGWDKSTQGRYGMLENIDDNFGLLMDKLDEWKLWDNTLVIFMTDNGQDSRNGSLNGQKVPMHTAGFKSGKATPFEGGTHVPSFWRWKGVLAEGKDLPALTAHLDLFPTFCELAGVDIPDRIQNRDGRSLVPLLEDSQADWPERTLFIHVGRWAKGADPNQSKYQNCAVRTPRWRFVNNQLLYDIKNDPYESTDVAAAYPDLVKRLRSEYDDWWQATVPLMVNENVPNSDHQPQVDYFHRQEQTRGIPHWSPPQF
ncbi:MAG TPA: arylsulfatase [Planctomicrobium sp.]|nr:arylsulfatase [Planctomicrobium sp.]